MMEFDSSLATAARPQPDAVSSTAAGGRREHVPEFDVLRGIAIVFVVYLHAYFSPWEVTPHKELLAMHIIHLFAQTAVPVFFFISAFLLAGDTSPSFPSFAVRKVRRIVVPLLFWMTAALAYNAWQGGGPTREMLHHYLLFDSSGQFYYLVVLVILMAAFYFVRDWPVRGLGLLTAGAFVANFATIVYYQSSAISGDFATLAYRNPLVWVFFYAFGLYVGRRFGSLDWTRRVIWPALAAMALVAAAYFILGERYGRYPVSYFGVTIFLFSSVSLVVYPALIQYVARSGVGQMVLRPAVFLSRYAFAIYLVHLPFFVGYLTNRYISPSDTWNQDYFKLMNALFVFGFLTSLAFAMTMGALFPRLSAELLGITPRPRRTPRSARADVE